MNPYEEQRKERERSWYEKAEKLTEAEYNAIKEVDRAKNK